VTAQPADIRIVVLSQLFQEQDHFDFRAFQLVQASSVIGCAAESYRTSPFTNEFFSKLNERQLFGNARGSFFSSSVPEQNIFYRSLGEHAARKSLSFASLRFSWLSW